MSPSSAAPLSPRRRSALAMAVGFGTVVLLYGVAAILLLDTYREPIYEAFGGGYGCGSDGIQAIPALIVAYFATAALVATSRATKFAGAMRVAMSLLVTIAVVAAIIGTLIVLALSSGIGCVE